MRSLPEKVLRDKQKITCAGQIFPTENRQCKTVLQDIHDARPGRRQVIQFNKKWLTFAKSGEVLLTHRCQPVVA
jgi:hypothetical protein